VPLSTAALISLLALSSCQADEAVAAGCATGHATVVWRPRPGGLPARSVETLPAWGAVLIARGGGDAPGRLDARCPADGRLLVSVPLGPVGAGSSADATPRCLSLGLGAPSDSNRSSRLVFGCPRSGRPLSTITWDHPHDSRGPAVGLDVGRLNDDDDDDDDDGDNTGGNQPPPRAVVVYALATEIGLHDLGSGTHRSVRLSWVDPPRDCSGCRIDLVGLPAGAPGARRRLLAGTAGRWSLIDAAAGAVVWRGGDTWADPSPPVAWAWSGFVRPGCIGRVVHRWREARTRPLVALGRGGGGSGWILVATRGKTLEDDGDDVDGGGPSRSFEPPAEEERVVVDLATGAVLLPGAALALDDEDDGDDEPAVTTPAVAEVLAVDDAGSGAVVLALDDRAGGWAGGWASPGSASVRLITRG